MNTTRSRQFNRILTAFTTIVIAQTHLGYAWQTTTSQPPSQPAALLLENKSAITSTAGAASPVQHIFGWDIDDQGRFGFHRFDKPYRHGAFVLLEPDGRVAFEMPLPPVLADQGVHEVRWQSSDRWLLFASEGQRTYVWQVEINSATFTMLASLEKGEWGIIASDGCTGFLVYRAHGAIIAYDGQGRERWTRHVQGNLPLRARGSSSITTTIDGRIVLCDWYCQNLYVFDENGRYEKFIDAGCWSRHCMGGGMPFHLFPDPAGGVYTNSPIRGELRRIRLNDDMESIARNPLLQWTRFERERVYHRREPPGYLRGEIAAVLPPGGKRRSIWGARVAPDGRIWVCDRQSFLRLDIVGNVDLVIGGTKPDDVTQQNASK